LKILLIIPARGDSKGIPRKNIRNLSGHPLIFYSIETALHSKYNLDVYVSSDDDEILHISKSIGAKIHKRSPKLSSDKMTLDPVIYNAYLEISSNNQCKYDYVITLQATSPILKSKTLDQAIEKMISSDFDTMISAAEDTHLSWEKKNDCFIPKYEKRLNRQELKSSYKETGGFVISKSEFVTNNSRFGKKIDLFVLQDGENIDIDDYDDWSICEYYLKRKKILFVVTGNNEFGLGHVYNSLIIANDITSHDLNFLVDKDSELGCNKIKSKNYDVRIQKSDNLIDDVLEFNPDIVINDRLNNSTKYMRELNKNGIKMINFEDDGEGSILADMTINAIYSSKYFQQNHYYGYQYYLLRDEFFVRKPLKSNNINTKVKKVLVTFGGTDPCNLTYKVLDSIYEYCIQKGIVIDVVTGMGYNEIDSLISFDGINIYKDVKNISDFMISSDIIFSAIGRTIYEIASLGIPAILLAQNSRELNHTFGYGENGFINLGNGDDVALSEIKGEFVDLVVNYEARKQMNKLMLQHDLRGGRKRVIGLIKDVIEQ
jgi:CMP-N-acetylneuraminic acid synthetase